MHDPVSCWWRVLSSLPGYKRLTRHKMLSGVPSSSSPSPPSCACSSSSCAGRVRRRPSTVALCAASACNRAFSAAANSGNASPLPSGTGGTAAHGHDASPADCAAAGFRFVSSLRPYRTHVMDRHGARGSHNDFY